MPPSRIAPNRVSVGASQSAALRLLSIGAATIALLILSIGTVVSSRQSTPPILTLAPFSVMSLILIVGVGAAAHWIPDRWLRISSGVAATVGVIGAAQQIGNHSTTGSFLAGPPWVATASAAAVLAALIAAGLWCAWGVHACYTTATLITRVSMGPISLDAWADVAQTFLGGVVLGFVCAQVLTLSRELDTAAQAATTARELAARERGRLSARTETAALVHDEVLATLTFAGSTAAANSTLLAQHAQHALDAVEQFTTPHTPETERALAQLEGAVAESFPNTTLTRSAAPEAPLPRDIPPAALHAIRFAVLQALQNSAQHAGPGVRSHVHISTHSDALSVVVSDNGVGFDPADVAEDRLGVRTSITQRVRAAGGSVTIASSPGAGTTISIDWSRTPPPNFPAPRTERLATVQFGVVAAAFVFTQLSLAVYSATLFPAWWAPLLAIAMLFATSEVLRMSPLGPPNLWITIVTVAGAVIVALLCAAVSPLSYGAQWAVVGAAFLLTTLAFRDRWISAAVGGVLVAAAFTAVALFRGAPAAVIAVVDLRVLLVTLVAAGLSVAVRVVQRRTAEQHSRGARARELTAWDAAARHEIEHSGAKLRKMIGPLLKNIAAGNPLSGDEQRDCALYAGRLRDQIRAGALDQEPLRSAAEEARSQGIDVLLLDDRGSDLPHSVVALMPTIAAHLSQARAQAVVRVLPEGRSSVISCVVDGTPMQLTARSAENHQN